LAFGYNPKTKSLLSQAFTFNKFWQQAKTTLHFINILCVLVSNSPSSLFFRGEKFRWLTAIGRSFLNTVTTACSSKDVVRLLVTARATL